MSKCVNCRKEMPDSEARLSLVCGRCRYLRKHDWAKIRTFSDRWREPHYEDSIPIYIGSEPVESES